MALYRIERRQGQCLVALEGDLTAVLVPDLQTALKKELEKETTEVLFDLKETAMLDSSGIGLLIATYNSLTQKKGGVKVINVSPDILRLLQSMRLTSRLSVSGRQ